MIKSTLYTFFIVCLVAFGAQTNCLAAASSGGDVQARQGGEDLLDHYFTDRFQFAARLSPIRTFIRAGAGQPAETFPDALVLSVSEPLSENTFFSIETFGGDIDVNDVGILAGESTAPVLVSAEEPGVYLLAIEIDGIVSQAQVRALSSDELPQDFTVVPELLTVQTNDQAEFTVTADTPAPPGGLEVEITPEISGSIPASITIPENQLTASVSYFAPAEPETGSITWALVGTTLSFETQVDVVEQTAPGLLPGRTFTRVGQNPAETFPEPLMLELTEPLSQNTFFVMDTSDPNISAENVNIIAGDSAGPVLVSATEPGIYFVSTELNGVITTSQVQALSPAHFPEELTVVPELLTVQTNAQAEFTVTVDTPAPPGGLEIVITSAIGGSIPASITIPENEITGIVPYSAPSEPATGSITWTITGTATQVETQVEVVNP